MTQTLLPPNATRLEAAFAAAIQLPSLDVPLRDLWNPETCPLAFLPWLAWSVGVDAWSSDWSEATKRDQIRKSIAEHKIKGSVQSVQNVLDFHGGGCELTEGFKASPPGPAYSFDLSVSADNPDANRTAAYVDTILGAVERVKPVRAKPTFTQSIPAINSVGVVAALRASLGASVQAETETDFGAFTYLTGADGAVLSMDDGRLLVGDMA